MKNLVGDLTNPLMPYKVNFCIKLSMLGMMSLLTKYLYPNFQEEERVSQVKFIRKYFNDDLRTHGGYAINFFLCEILTFINVIGQIFFTDR